MARIPISRKSLEGAVLGLVALFLSGALLRVFSGGATDLVTSGDRRFEIILGFLYLAVTMIGFVHFKRTFVSALSVPALICLLLLAILSSIWADLPGLVLRRTMGLTGATLFGLVLAAELDFEEQLNVLRRVFRFAVTLTLAAWALGPFIGMNIVSGESTTIKGYQVQIEEGAWRGIFNHKNALGAAMALAILIEWHAPVDTMKSKVWKTLYISCYVCFLALSHSITSLVSVCLTLLLMFSLKTFRHQYRLIVPILLLLTICTAAVITLNATSMTGILGRSADLSGRVELWHWVGAMILNRPMLGYGFSGFWKGASDYSDVIETRIGWSPEYAHNGYLEITLSLGVVGLFLFLWSAGTGLRRAIGLAKTAESAQDLWPLAFLIFFLIHNLGECTILLQNSLEWAICVATIVGADPRLHPRFEAAPSEEELILNASPEYT
jgi:exopolysaccharide production protein ExoQ